MVGENAENYLKYSNFGVATLGDVLEKTYDKDYTTLINEYISSDLGLLK